MLIANTLEESNRYCDQEISHILRIEQKPLVYFEDDKRYLIDNQRECLCDVPEFVPQTTIRTKKYGTLVFMKSISDFLESKYNKSVLAVYCSDKFTKQRKRTINTVVVLSTYEESLEFEDREFSNSGGLYMNELSGIEKQQGFLVVVERNKNTSNGVQLIDNFKLKS